MVETQPRVPFIVWGGGAELAQIGKVRKAVEDRERQRKVEVVLERT